MLKKVHEMIKDEMASRKLNHNPSQTRQMLVDLYVYNEDLE